MNTYKHLIKEERHLIYLLWNKEKYSMNYHLLKLVERKTRLAIIRKIKCKNPRTMMAKMYTIIRDEKLPIKTIIVDNGLEFQMMGITAKQFNFKVYYCQPYRPLQRGTNENIIKTKKPQLIFHSQEFNLTLKCYTSYVS